MRALTVGGAVGIGDQRQNIPDLFGVILRFGARLREQLLLQCDPRRFQHRRIVELSRNT